MAYLHRLEPYATIFAMSGNEKSDSGQPNGSKGGEEEEKIVRQDIVYYSVRMARRRLQEYIDANAWVHPQDLLRIVLLLEQALLTMTMSVAIEWMESEDGDTQSDQDARLEPTEVGMGTVGEHRREPPRWGWGDVRS